MQRKVILTIVAVALFLIVFDVSAMMFGGDGERHRGTPGDLVGTVIDEDGFPNPDSRLWVYGNVNEDDRIDEDDISALKGILGSDLQATVLADANADGLVDERDLVYLERIIASDDIDVYYIDNYYRVSKVSWPVETIAIGYCSGAYSADVTGLCDKVIMVDTTIEAYWYVMNPAFESASSWGDHENPSYESLMVGGIDVFVPGYCVSGTDGESRTLLEPVGIDVMFMNTSDNSGVDYPNEHIDRSILMFAFLLQGDMEKTYSYLEWHDDLMDTMTSAASTISDDERVSFMMARSSPFYNKTGQYSITGKDNTNNIHATWAGVDAIGQHSELLQRNYNNRTAEDILTLIDTESNTGVMFYMDNAHDGMRKQYDLDDCVAADMEMLKDAKTKVHYLGMAREAGNSPLYIVEMVFYQCVMYPELSDITGLDYRQVFNEYFDRFASYDYSMHVDIDDFFKDYGEI